MTTTSRRQTKWLDQLARQRLLPMHVYVELRQDPRLLDAFQFFVAYWQEVYATEVDAYIVESALDDARAEVHARRSGWTTHWRQDDAGWRELTPAKRAHTPPSAVVAVDLHNAGGEIIAANRLIERWGPSTKLWRTRRRRAIEAGLAIQAIREQRR